jgi:uncharacterized repeat protein (TIGR03803 family)
MTYRTCVPRNMFNMLVSRSGLLSALIARWQPRRLFAPVSLVTAIAIEVFAFPGLGAAQVPFEVLHSFTGSPDDGANPAAALIQATDGTFYGTTDFGGLHEGTICDSYTCGTVFQMTPDGTVTLTHKFNWIDGFSRKSPLIQVADGTFYGTTSSNAAYGEVFRMTPDGSIALVHVFGPPFPNGANPYAAVIQADDGTFYGTTQFGGLPPGFGTVFQIIPGDPVHTFSVLHRFTGADGKQPVAALIQASDGTFYGTTVGGGDFNLGTVFQMTNDGVFTVVHSFTGADGAGPLAALIQATDGTFYGTTVGGGDFNLGTVFQMTNDGVVTVVHSFTSADGAGPLAALIQATDGTFYGTTASGGDFNLGTVFQMTNDGVVTVVHSFTGDDGANPYAALLQADDGYLYGTTYSGGASGMGVVFRVMPTGQRRSTFAPPRVARSG